MENINEQFNRLFCELDLADEQAAMIKKLQRDVDAALHQPPVMRRSEQLVCPDCKGLEIYIDEYGGKPCQCTKEAN